MAIIDFPILYVPDPIKGKPLAQGQLFVGEPDLDPEIIINQKQLRIVQEDGTKIDVGQPFILSDGGVPVYQGSTVRLDVDGNFSLKILNSFGSQKYYIENVFEGQPVTRQEVVLKFDTLADAIVNTELVDDDEFTVGDRGNSTWKAIPLTTPSSGAPDIGSIVTSTGVPTLSFEIIPGSDGLITFEMYGIDITGATSASTDIQSALDSITNITIGSGAFKIDSTVYIKGNGRTLVANGVAEAVFNVQAGIEGLVIGNDATSSDTNHNMNVGGFKISGGATGLSVGGNGTGPKAVLGSIHDIEITGATTRGLRLISPQGVKFSDLNVRDNALGCFFDTVQAITASQFLRCRFFQNTAEGVLIHGCEGISFISCNVEANGTHGVSMIKQVGKAIAGVVFSNECWFEGNGASGASNSIFGDDTAIASVSIDSVNFNGLANGTRHIELPANEVVLTNNRLIGGDASFSINTKLSGFNNAGDVVVPANQFGLFSHNGVTYGRHADLRETLTIQGTALTDRTDPAINVVKGRLFMEDSTIRMFSPNAVDGESIAQFDINSGGTGVQVERYNCGADDDRVGIQFGYALANFRTWYDDAGNLRTKTSDPTSNNDGTVIGTQTATLTHLYKIGEEIEIGDTVKLVSRKLYKTTSLNDPLCVGVYAGLSDGLVSSFGEPNVRQPINDNSDNYDDELLLLPESDLGAIIAVGDTRTNQSGVETQFINCTGTVNAGDYLCSSSVVGKAMAQGDDIMHSYTIGKAIDVTDGNVYAYIYSG